ncbi:MAG: glycosyltransferase family 9 protein [Bacteroidetes bacterium]|nr:glycosyltransferase family 9 protein [Bacteroidota bacterium]
MAGVIRKFFPKCRIIFLGRTYTKDVIALSEHVDEFIDYTEMEKLPAAEQITALQKRKIDVFIHVFPKSQIAWLVKKAGIPFRIGTTNRLYHWLTCNEKLKLSRKNSSLHESQLNMKLLEGLGIKPEIALDKMPSFYGFTNLPEADDSVVSLLDKTKFNVILHPRSKGSAKEWGLQNFSRLIEQLPEEKYKIFISGTTEDGLTMQDFIQANKKAVDITGKLSLRQFIAFINAADGLVAASTGPLHIAASLGKKAIGLFSPRRPIHPGRWKPVGRNAHALVFDADCIKCANKEDCDCITKINPGQIVDLLKS